MLSFLKVLPINGELRPLAVLKRHRSPESWGDSSKLGCGRETVIGPQQSAEKGDSDDHRRGHEPRDDE